MQDVSLRHQQARATAAAYDLAIVGGGVNGCGIARDAAGRGLSVYLCEQGDLASGTSSASTKLIHGGLRYLEHYDFRLVREALAEREVLLGSAPHIVRPLRFVLPHHGGLRPWPIIRLGLFIYDHLGGRHLLPATRTLDLAVDAAGKGLKPVYRRAFEYSDCRVDDARLVVLNARDAADRGAEIRTRIRCVGARRDGGLWHLELRDGRDETRSTVTAKCLINAAGPWVAEVISEVAGLKPPARVRLVKGSHLVVDRVFDHDRAYVFQNADKRICFAIPYERDFTLIGTTDEDFAGDPASVTITEGETDYLLAAVSAYLARPLSREMIRWSYSGVRPLYDDGASKAQETTRDYVLGLDAPAGKAPLLSVFGGKITTCRRLAEHALKKIAPWFPQMRGAWTREAKLPGGEIAVGGYDAWEKEMASRYAFVDAALVSRLCRAYGTRARLLLSGVARAADLGHDFGAGLSARELDYLATHEWAETAEDVLWRRSKLGLRLRPEAHAAVQAYLDELRGKKPHLTMAGETNT
jgi:glycerol-3-phosphate dehydrogenase